MTNLQRKKCPDTEKVFGRILSRYPYLKNQTSSVLVLCEPAADEVKCRPLVSKDHTHEGRRRKPFEKRENEMYQRSGFSLATNTQNPVTPPNNALHLLSSLPEERFSIKCTGWPAGWLLIIANWIVLR
ncbi:hypothetical protein AVEN_16790-1 [Araneus ventricosus]|uniref:Uncharacterized protein n=1 Tax=Araneus ventricosus TaxID=182803 RepID=A0A4Y2BSW7_ARAVE|nr:hypothetical protein AVEN_16790-1 [Araneus ventricosus]